MELKTQTENSQATTPKPVQQAKDSLSDSLGDNLQDPLLQLDIGSPSVSPGAAGGPADDGSPIQAAAKAGVSGGGGSMPFAEQIQASFGRHDISDVQAHTGAAAQGANAAMGSKAFATGSDVAFGGSPDLHTAAHEAAHTVQQKGGVQLSGGVGKVGDRYEQNADAVADRVVQGKSAEDLLDPFAGGGSAGAGVQHKPAGLAGAAAGAAAAAAKTAAKPRKVKADDGTWYKQVGDQYYFYHGKLDKWVEATGKWLEGAKKALNGGGEETKEEPTEKKKSEIKNATTDLGTQKSLDNGFTSKAGTLLDAIIPNEGDKAKFQLNVNIPVQPGVDVGFEFITESSRDDKGVKVRCQVGGGVTAKIDVWVAEVFATAKVFGYMEAQGDTSAEAFDLMILGIQQRIASVSTKVANAIFDGKMIEQTIKNMEGENYVESGLGASFGLGAEVKGGGPGAEAGVTASTGTKLTKGNDGKLDKTGVSKLEASAKVSVSPFSVEGKRTLEFEKGKLSKFETELSGDAMLAGPDMSELFLQGTMLATLISKTAGVIKTAKSMSKDPSAARGISSLAGFVGAEAGAMVALNGGTKMALKQLAKLEGFKMGFKLTVKAAYVVDKGPEFEVTLEKVQQMEFGENPRSKVYVLVENINNIFTIKKP